MYKELINVAEKSLWNLNCIEISESQHIDLV